MVISVNGDEFAEFKAFFKGGYRIRLTIDGLIGLGLKMDADRHVDG